MNKLNKFNIISKTFTVVMFLLLSVSCRSQNDPKVSSDDIRKQLKKQIVNDGEVVYTEPTKKIKCYSGGMIFIEPAGMIFEIFPSLGFFRITQLDRDWVYISIDSLEFKDCVIEGEKKCRLSNNITKRIHEAMSSYLNENADGMELTCYPCEDYILVKHSLKNSSLKELKEIDLVIDKREGWIQAFRFKNKWFDW